MWEGWVYAYDNNVENIHKKIDQRITLVYFFIAFMVLFSAIKQSEQYYKEREYRSSKCYIPIF